MTLSRAIVWTDHQSARILPVDPGSAEARTIHAHSYATAQHGSGVRTQHEYFAALCDAIDAASEVLVAGSHTALSDFKHYVGKHRPHSAQRIVGYEGIGHLTDPQLAALARKHFADMDRHLAAVSP